MTSARAAILIATMLWGMSTTVIAQDSVFLEQLTWMEVRDAILAARVRQLTTPCRQNFQ